MARPYKTGLDYFPFDVDFFRDEKILSIAKEFGPKGELCVISTIVEIKERGLTRRLRNAPLRNLQ